MSTLEPIHEAEGTFWERLLQPGYQQAVVDILHRLFLTTIIILLAFGLFWWNTPYGIHFIILDVLVTLLYVSFRWYVTMRGHLASFTMAIHLSSSIRCIGGTYRFINELTHEMRRQQRLNATTTTTTTTTGTEGYTTVNGTNADGSGEVDQTNSERKKKNS